MPANSQELDSRGGHREFQVSAVCRIFFRNSARFGAENRLEVTILKGLGADKLFQVRDRPRAGPVVSEIEREDSDAIPSERFGG